MILWIIAALVFWSIIWVVWLRDWLHQQPWAWSQTFFAAIEPVEILLWSKSATILYARLQQLAAVLLIVLPSIGAIDLTPVIGLFPEQHQGWIRLIPSAALIINSIIGELQRHQTTKPVELVAVPDYSPVAPEVRQAVVAADEVKKEAVAVIQEAKAEGKTA